MHRVAILALLSCLALVAVLWDDVHRAIVISQPLPSAAPQGAWTEEPLVLPRVLSGHDEDGDGKDDLDDLVIGARAEALNRTVYQDGYYAGGHPPDGVGVCTDVIWRAFEEAGYDLKSMVDADIAANIEAYPRVGGRAEPNIDFRRVPNLTSFFQRHAQELSIEVIPGDAENLSQWQGGDIVVYGQPFPHIGIVSDRRRPDGVPLLIHNGGPHATEADDLLTWPSPMTHRFRFPNTSAQ